MQRISTRVLRTYRPLTATISRSLSTTPRPKRDGPLTWRTLAVFTALGTGALAYYSVKRQQRIDEIMKPTTIGKAAIGGPFTLLNAANEPFTEKNLLGKWSLIYFGFSMCPDICPAELTKVAEALKVLQKHGKAVGDLIVPIFITVDPERDTPARADEYAKAFHEAFVGLGGAEDIIKDVAKKYRVYYTRDETPGDDYLVDHSIITYLMDPNGEFVEFYTKNTSSVEMAARIEGKMLAWKK